MGSDVCTYLGVWVTPLAGVWIEILIRRILSRKADVTPLAGVWIEIELRNVTVVIDESHTPRGCVD